MRIQKTPFVKIAFKRITAAITAVLFLLTTVPDRMSQAYAASSDTIQARGGTLPQDPSRLIRDERILIPPGLGTIDEVYRATDNGQRSTDSAQRATRNAQRKTEEVLSLSVERDTLPAAGGRKTIVFVQDAHDSLEAQENIAKIIDHLVANYGVNTVFEEGYEGPVPTDHYFDAIQDPAIKEKISYFLMDHLRLGGAEYAHINRHKATKPKEDTRAHDKRPQEKATKAHATRPQDGNTEQLDNGVWHVAGDIVADGRVATEQTDSPRDWNLIGADSLKLHKENISQYRLSAAKQNVINRDLKALDKELKTLVDKRFPKELKEWLKIKARFDAKQLDLFSYINRTVPLLPEATGHKATKSQEEDISHKATKTHEAEEPNSVMWHVADGHVAVAPLLHFLIEAAKSNDPVVLEKARYIDAREVFGELAKLDQGIADQYLQNATDKRLFDYYKILSLLNRLNALEVSQEEYVTVKKTLKEFDTRSFAQFIFDQAPKTLILSKMWERNIKDAIKFYEIAAARDGAISEAIEKYFVAGTINPQKVATHKATTLQDKDKRHKATKPHETDGQDSVVWHVAGNHVADEKRVAGNIVAKPKLSGVEPAILVYGGFHKENIKRILESKGISYVVVSPRIAKSSPRHEAFYKRLMTEGRLAHELPAAIPATATRAESRLEVWNANPAIARAEIRVMEEIARKIPRVDPASYGLAVEQALKNFASEGPGPGPAKVNGKRLHGDADKEKGDLIPNIREAILALDAAGVDLSSGAITTDHTKKTKNIIREILGREMAGGQFYDVAHKAFKDRGGWFGALKAAGLDIQDARFRPVQSAEDVQKISDAIKTLAAAGVGLGAGSLMRDKTQKTRAILRDIFGLELTAATFYNKAHKAFRNHGGWDGAVRAAGFDPNGIRRTFFWSKEEINKIPQAIKTLFGAGVDLNSVAITKDRTERTQEILDKVFERKMTGAALYKKAVKVFRNQNGWIGALRAAGLDPKEVRQKALSGADAVGTRSEVRKDIAQRATHKAQREDKLLSVARDASFEAEGQSRAEVRERGAERVVSRWSGYFDKLPEPEAKKFWTESLEEIKADLQKPEADKVRIERILNEFDPDLADPVKKIVTAHGFSLCSFFDLVDPEQAEVVRQLSRKQLEIVRQFGEDRAVLVPSGYDPVRDKIEHDRGSLHVTLEGLDHGTPEAISAEQLVKTTARLKTALKGQGTIKGKLVGPFWHKSLAIVMIWVPDGEQDPLLQAKRDVEKALKRKHEPRPFHMTLAYIPQGEFTAKEFKTDYSRMDGVPVVEIPVTLSRVEVNGYGDIAFIDVTRVKDAVIDLQRSEMRERSGRELTEAERGALESFRTNYQSRLTEIDAYPDPAGVSKVLENMEFKDGRYRGRVMLLDTFALAHKIEADEKIIRDAKQEFRGFLEGLRRIFREDGDKIQAWEPDDTAYHMALNVFQESLQNKERPLEPLSSVESEGIKTLVASRLEDEPGAVETVRVGYGVTADGGFVLLLWDGSGRIRAIQEFIATRAKEMTGGKTGGSRPKRGHVTIGRILSLPYSEDPALRAEQERQVLDHVRNAAKEYEKAWKTNLTDPALKAVYPVSQLTLLHEKEWLALSGPGHLGDIDLPLGRTLSDPERRSEVHLPLVAPSTFPTAAEEGRRSEMRDEKSQKATDSVLHAGKNVIKHGLSTLATMAQAWVIKASKWDDRSQKDANKIAKDLQRELDKIAELIREHLRDLSLEDRRELTAKITGIKNHKKLRSWVRSQGGKLSAFQESLERGSARSEIRTTATRVHA
ncbi:MAG: hypothetical protein KTQ49_01185, partial [Candidatus Omnitrophica bacterium]|nr:hypothetical protein [Candidatus Omnitrophota bacterium]